MAKKITIYVHDENSEKLKEYKNKSSIINEALNLYFSNKTYFLSKKAMIEEQRKMYLYKVKLENIKLKECEKHLKEIEEKYSRRPKEYEESVRILKITKDVTLDDVQYQAKRLGVDTTQFKTWLLNDGHYEEIFSLE